MRLSSRGVACYCLNCIWGSLWFFSQKEFFHSIPPLVEMVIQTCDQRTVLASCWCQATKLNWPYSHPVPSDWSTSPTCAAREWTHGPALPMRWAGRLGLHACRLKENGLFRPPYSKTKKEVSRPEALNGCHLMEKEKGLGGVQPDLKLLSSTETLKCLKILFAIKSARSIWKQCCTTCTKGLPDIRAMPSAVQQEKVSCMEQLDLGRRTETVKPWSEKRRNFNKSSAWQSLESKGRDSHTCFK